MKGKLGARIAVIVIFAAVVYCGVKSSKIQHFFKPPQGMYVLVAGYGAIAVAFAGIR